MPAGRPGTARSLTRCVRRSYRLELMAAGQPCLLWLSGRDRARGARARHGRRGRSRRDDGPAVAGPADPARRARPPGRAARRSPDARGRGAADAGRQQSLVAVGRRSSPRCSTGRAGPAWDDGARESEPAPLGRARLAADPAVLRRRDRRAVPLRGPYSRADDVISALGAADSAAAAADERLVRPAGGADPGRHAAAAAGAAAGGRRQVAPVLLGGAAVGVLLVGVFPIDGNSTMHAIGAVLYFARRRAGADRAGLRRAAALGGAGDDAGAARPGRHGGDGVLPGRRHAPTSARAAPSGRRGTSCRSGWRWPAPPSGG